jgi:hypothetical protein
MNGGNQPGIVGEVVPEILHSMVLGLAADVNLLDELKPG